MSKIKHIYWFAPYDLSCPSTRYRGLYPLQLLAAEKKISYDFIIPKRSWKQLFRFLFIFMKALLSPPSRTQIVIQKVCSNRLYAKALKILVFFKRKNTLYDIDDAEYFRQATDTLHFFLKYCHCVQVGSLALFDYCSVFNKNVYISTSPVSKHDARKALKNDKINIGWVGDVGDGNSISSDFSHKRSLFEILFPQLLNLQLPIKLSIIGVKNISDIAEIQAYFKDQPNIELDIPTTLNWENDTWIYEKISQFDVGVSPLVKHPFNEAKSAFKAKQYLSCGVPCIASDVGENRNYVIHLKNGFIAEKPEDFLVFIHKIVALPEKEYIEFVENALNSTGGFSLENYCSLFLDKTICK